MITIARAVVLAALLIAPGLAAAAEPSAEQKAFMDAHHKMMAGMSADPTGDADKDFAMMMIPHHQGAIDMAKVELQYGKDPELRAMAEKIVAAQQAEIAQLEKWLAAHK